MAKAYLFAVQTESGHEIVAAKIETPKVSTVEAHRLANGLVTITNDGDVVETSKIHTQGDEELTLYRWPAHDKTGKPVAKKVTA